MTAPDAGALVCTVCGAGLGGATRHVSSRPLCGASACRATRERERRAAEPGYGEAQRRRSRQWAARRAERRALAVKSPDGWVRCAGGCDRKYPAGSLAGGTCGGPWCPAGVPIEDAEDVRA